MGGAEGWLEKEYKYVKASLAYLIWQYLSHRLILLRVGESPTFQSVWTSDLSPLPVEMYFKIILFDKDHIVW